MTTAVVDIETESLSPSHIWCICVMDADTEETDTFINPTSIPEEKERFLAYCKTVDRFVLHNGIGFDVPVINRLLGECIKKDQVLDTLVVSRLKNYGILGGHSLAAWGERLGFPKLVFKAFEQLTPEMITYCEQDVLVTYKLYKKLLPFINEKTQATALQVEHDIQWLCEDMTTNGFYFNEDAAEEMLGEVLGRMEELEAGFQKDFPPKLVNTHNVKYRLTKDGKEFASVTKAKQKYPIHTVDGDTLLCYEFVPFSPASPKQRIDRLWEAGWNPTDKTKGHIEYERSSQRY